MDWNRVMRQGHRWLALAFTLGFLANIIVMSMGMEPGFWVYLLVLIPLFLLLPTGIYMFVLPYAARWRGVERGNG